MKTAKPNIKLLFYGFCLATVLYNCKTKDVDSLTPFTYTFKGFTDVKLPDVKPTAPAAVSVTSASVTSSTAAAAVSSGLSSMSATGVVPASVQQAASDVGKAITPAAASQLSASFTPDVIKTMSTTGEIPANLKSQLTALSNNSALKAYLPTFTLPTVNGKAVGGRVGATSGSNIVATVATANAALDDDACKAAANAAYNTALAGLQAIQASQTAAINANFTQIQTGISAESAPCKAGLTAKYTPLRAAAQQAFDAGMASLDANKALLGGAYDLLRLLYLAALADANDVFTKLQAAETTACDAVGAAKLVNAQAARDKDLSTINSNFNAAAGSLKATLTKATASCHNQGNGG
ncbi:hypothetical protein GCM10028818_05280 [Spirosoma horti]